MLKVTKIIEGGINLETQEELPRSIVVSNGHREMTIPVDDVVLAEVIQLYAENGKMRPEDAAEFMKPDPPEPIIQRPPPSPQPVHSAPSPFEDAPEPSFDDEGFEPGEEFNDGGTGASSL